MPTLQIQLLGAFQLLYNGEAVNTLNQGRLHSLLAYLLLHRATAQSRQRIAFLFWPDSSEAQARANLRQALHNLRQAWPDADHFLQIETKTVQWRSDAPFTLDVAEFEHQLSQADEAAQGGDDAGARTALRGAVDSYRGELLPGCYDEWILPERERWQQAFFKVLERLISLAEAQRDFEAAIDYAQRLLRYDPLHETTYGRLMRLYALHGDRASALRIYHTCATLLQRELGVEPNLQLRSAYENLLNLEESSAVLSTRNTQFGEKLIGRQAEWQNVLNVWRGVTHGRAHFVVVAGEAGIGKTRLAEELATWVGRQGIRTAHTRAYAAEGALAYAPVAEWLRTEPLRAGWHSLDAVWLTELARILPELLVEQPRLPRPEPLRESWQRRRLFEALGRALLTDDRPLLLVLDDLQWCDHETLEWLHYLLRYAHKASLLVVGTVRPEEITGDHPLTTLLLELRGAEQVSELELGPLSMDETAALAMQVAGQRLAPEVVKRLYSETEGNPLFVVEMMRADVSRAEGSLRGEGASFSSSPLSAHAPLPLPAKVRAVIQRRLAQLSPTARELANLASVLGRSFTFPVLAQASDLTEETLIRGLDELWQRRIVRELGADAYDFSHDRIREVTQATISQTQRRLLHRRAAQALEMVYASDLEPISGQLAVHYERAGLPLPATRYYQQAGAVAQRIYANEEAISLYNKGIALLATMPNHSERARHELALQIALVVPLATNAGYGSPRLLTACQRARELASQLGEAAAPAVLRALAIGNIGRLWFRDAQEIGEQLLVLALHNQDPILFTEAYYVLGVTSFFQGEFVRARSQLEQAIGHYKLANSPTHIAQYAQDPKVVCLCRLALVLWYLGYPDQAEQLSRAALTFAQQLGHPFSLVYCLFWNAMVQQHRGNNLTMLEQIETGIGLIHAHHLGTFSHWMNSLHGWALAEQGNFVEGIVHLQTSMEQAREAGTQTLESFHLGLLAQLYIKQGNFDQALHLLDETLAQIEKTGEHWRTAEVYHCKGELMLQQDGDTVESEQAFLRAIALAQRQEAKALELRAAVSLSRLWHSAGRINEARQLLTSIYAWFTEGFDTRDFQEASALLAILS